MSNSLYLVTNLLDGATITTSSEDALFLEANLYAGYPSRTFRFAAAGADDMITIDLGSAQSVDFCSIHGHNIDSGVTAIELRRSTDDFSGSDVLRATFTKRDPAMFVYTSSPSSTRYWRIKFVGTNASPIEVGEVVLGLASTLTQDAGHHQEMVEIRRQIRNRTRGGEVSIVNVADFATKELTMFYKGSFTALEDIRDNLWAATNHGKKWCAIVPNDDRPEVLFGHLRQDLPITRMYADDTAGRELYQYVLSLSESAFGTSVAVAPVYGAGVAAGVGAVVADGTVE